MVKIMIHDVEKAINIIADKKIEKATEELRLKYQDTIHDMLVSDIQTAITKYETWCKSNLANPPDLKSLLWVD